MAELPEGWKCTAHNTYQKVFTAKKGGGQVLLVTLQGGKWRVDRFPFSENYRFNSSIEAMMWAEMRYIT